MGTQSTDVHHQGTIGNRCPWTMDLGASTNKVFINIPTLGEPMNRFMLSWST